MSFGTKVLTTAFVTGQAVLHPKDIDLRQEPLSIREALKGELIPVVIYGQYVYNIPEPLLKVTSTHAADFVTKRKIDLPADGSALDVDPRGVGVFLDYIKSLTHVTKPLPLQLRYDDDDVETLLGVCQAAQILGMDKYVGHLIRKADTIFYGLPSYDDLDVVVCRTARYPRIYGIAVRTFARMVREGKIPDPEEFEKYLSLRNDFAQAIEEANVKHDNWVQMEAKREHREEQRIRDEVAAQAKVVAFNEQEKERLAREKQFWAAKNTHDATLRKATELKMRTSGSARKFTPEERAWYVKNYGKQPPKGC